MYNEDDYKRNKKKSNKKNKRVDYSRLKKNKHQIVNMDIDNMDFQREIWALQGLIPCSVCDLPYPLHLEGCPYCAK